MCCLNILSTALVKRLQFLFVVLFVIVVVQLNTTKGLFCLLLLVSEVTIMFCDVHVWNMSVQIPNCSLNKTKHATVLSILFALGLLEIIHIEPFYFIFTHFDLNVFS